MLELGLGSSMAGPSRAGAQSFGKTGTWQLLPSILSGFCIYPYHPSASPLVSPTSPVQDRAGVPSEETRPSHHKNRFSWSGIPSARTGDRAGGGKTNAYEVPLDVGDEFFAFEEYRCALEEDEKGEVWYRGYVVQAVSLQSLALPAPTVSGGGAAYPRPEPSVLIGIFPSAVVHVRQQDAGDDGRLAAAYEKAVRQAQEQAAATSRVGEMEAVKEEDEGEGLGLTPGVMSDPSGPSAPTSLEDHGVVGDGVASKRRSIGPGGGIGRSNRPKSLLLESMQAASKEEEKDQPPLPQLTAGDATLAGAQWPLVDEIACAIREWYGRLPTYLANKEYRLFGIVVQHIDALYLGRRQLIQQTLSADELQRVRRECVSRLVKCNVAQGLEVIVRSLEDGSVVVVDRDRSFDGASWVGGVEAYVKQVQFAYIDLIPLDSSGKGSVNVEKRSLKSPSHARSLSHPITEPHLVAGQSTAQFYHLLLDVRAFIASPCASGETAELYFSLFNKTENRFLTEEFCLVLNHLGSPARDAEQRLGRLRTLFTDLKADNIGSSTVLVCRLVRNGALKMRAEAMGTLDGHRRASTLTVPQRGSVHHMSDMGTVRSSFSLTDNATDDSFSITSGFGGHRTTTVESAATGTAASIIEGRPTFRRPLGCAVLELPQLSKLLSEGADKSGPGLEFSMPIYVPREEETFATLHEDIINNRTKEVATTPRADAIAISLRVLKGAAPSVIRENPSLLLDIPISARLGFPDVVFPGVKRNDLYLKLWSGSFVPSPRSTGGSIRIRKLDNPVNNGNVQVTLEVRRQDGTLIPDALFAGDSGEAAVAQYHSLVFTHTDRPTFGELVKVTLPDDTEGCHLFLTFRSRGKDRHVNADPHELERPFAFAYLPLCSSSMCIKDGAHDLVLYRMESNLQPAPNLYFDAPAVSSDGAVPTIPRSKGMTPLRDRMSLRSYLCSTTHSQDDTLRSLFAWQTLSDQPSALESTLQLFGFVGEEEIARFVPAVLDSLFGILTLNLGDRQDEMDDLVFSSLIKVLAMTSDRRFPNFGDVLAIYVDRHFNYPASSFRLLRSMKHVMSDPGSKDYRAFLKVWHLVFRLIIRSRQLDRSRGVGSDTTSAHIEADFKRQMKAVLGEINALMRSTDKGLIGTQTLAVQHYADILPGLIEVYPALEIAEMVIAFTETLTHVRGTIAIHKLLLLLEVVQGLFDSAECRTLLIPAIVRWLKPHLGRYDDAGQSQRGESQSVKDARKIKWLECNRLAMTVVAWTVNKLQETYASPAVQDNEEVRAQEEENIEYCLTLLPNLCASYNELSNQQTADFLGRHRSSGPIWKQTPDVFPTTHPFALISQLPPPSLLERHQHADEDGLVTSGTLNCGLAESAVVILSLILATPRANLVRYLLEVLDIEGTEVCSSVLKSTFGFASSVIRWKGFPSQWLTVALMSFSAIVKLLDAAAELMQRAEFIPPVQDAEGFDEELWRKCFELLCDVCGSEELALEDQSQQRRRAGWIIAGDLRDQGANLLLTLWNAVGWPVTQDTAAGLRYGGYQTRFTDLADKVLGLCMSSHDQLCETAVEILFSMIYAENVLYGKYETIETAVFSTLDTLFSSRLASGGDPTMRAYFVAQLRSVFESTPSIDETFRSKVGTFLDEVELFIDLLLAVRDLPESTEWKEERAAATYRLMEFIRRIGRTDLYVRFVYQLVQIMVNSRDWLGAGLALKLHADLHAWSHEGEMMDAFNEGGIQLPIQTPFARRESLCYHAIDYFAEAEAYEFALDLCQELTAQHQTKTYNVDKLSELLVHQAKLWERIGQSPRTKPEYFRVAYFGDGFTPLNLNKEFVVRGEPWQRYSDFCDQIHSKFPNASIHRSKIPPSSRMREEGDIVWVTSVVPEQNPAHPALQEGVSANVRDYHRYNGVTTFSSTRPYMVDPTETDAVLTWTEKTILTVADKLPGLLTRSEVIDVRYLQISPLSSAIAEVIKATEHLRLLSKGKPGQSVDVKQLGTAINGAVDSPVNGGVELYREKFLDGSYLERHPQDGLAVQQLRQAVLDYVRAIQEALSVHRELCKDLAFHEALKSHFYKAYPEEISQLPRMSEGSIDTLMLPSHANVNGVNGSHGDTASISVPPTPISKDSPRLSMASDASRKTDKMATVNSYFLPPLRLGPTPMNGSGSRHPNIPPTATSSPKPTSMSNGSGSPRTSRSNTASPAPGSSLLSRARSIVEGMSARSASPAGSDGTVQTSMSGVGASARGAGADSGNEVVRVGGKARENDSQSGLKRFSSMLKR